MGTWARPGLRKGRRRGGKESVAGLTSFASHCQAGRASAVTPSPWGPCKHTQVRQSLEALRDNLNNKAWLKLEGFMKQACAASAAAEAAGGQQGLRRGRGLRANGGQGLAGLQETWEGNGAGENGTSPWGQVGGRWAGHGRGAGGQELWERDEG